MRIPTPPERSGDRVARRALDIPVLLVVAAAMVVGLLAGLARMGYAMPPAVTDRAVLHGPILAAGVLGTLIALERAVALSAVGRRRWSPAYLAPLAGGLGTSALLVSGATPIAQLLLVLGAAGLLAVNGSMFRTQPSIDVGAMALGAVLLLVADTAWLVGRPIPLVAHWWVAFLVLTIVGERSELARLRRLSDRAGTAFAVIIAGYLGALALIAIDADLGVRLSGVAMLALAAWLMRYDVAWLTVRRPGLPRFVATCLLTGYAWLAIGGLLAVANGMLWAGPMYDALLHATLVGFVFSMIFGHAPIIVPAIVGIAIGFHPVAYLPLGLLQLSVVLRIAGDLAPDAPLRMAGGLLGTMAIALYAVAAVVMALAGRAVRRGPVRPSDPRP